MIILIYDDDEEEEEKYDDDHNDDDDDDDNDDDDDGYDNTMFSRAFSKNVKMELKPSLEICPHVLNP